MSETIDVTVPDIGDFTDVEVIEILVAPGDRVERESSLITIESDKATLEVPSPRAGTVRELVVGLGDTVSEGSLILRLEVDESAAEAAPPPAAPAEAERTPPRAAAPAGPPARAHTPSDRHAEVVVLGGGPGGYTAAFRAADLGKRVILVERYPRLGGVCLNVGCIPSKALLHVAEVVNDARDLGGHGVRFGEPRVDLAGVRGSVERVVGRLTRGLDGLAQKRGVSVVTGLGRFSAPDQISVTGDAGTVTIGFDDVIVATGSRPAELPDAPCDDPRLMDSTGALALADVPERLLIVGGGIIGLEIATIYAALGAAITVVEFTDTLMPGCDRDLVQPLQRRIARHYENIFLGTRVTGVAAEPEGLRVRLEGGGAPASDRFGRVLVAIGRRPNADGIGAEVVGLAPDERGFLPVDSAQRTAVPHIYAIGDVVGGPMLAHKAMAEGRVAAEVIAGLPAAFDPMGVPSVAYTDPEIAWVGLTETEARERGVAYEKGSFPWAASGRALGMGRTEGLTKVLVDPETRRLLGVGVVGRHAGELIAEAVLALEMGADAEDLALSVHPHPTLSETVRFAAEVVEGTITDLYAPRRGP